MWYDDNQFYIITIIVIVFFKFFCLFVNYGLFINYFYYNYEFSCFYFQENIKDLVENLFMKKESLFNNSNDVIKSDVVNDGTEVNDEDLNNRKRKNNQR